MTEFRFNKKTGEITQIGEANDEPDRILKTNRKGEVKYKKNGEAKVALGDIEQGILADGQNWKTDDQIIDVGGEGQASLEGVEDFVTRFSEHVGVEMSGEYLSQEDKADATISKVYVDEYKGNKPKQSSASFTKLFTDPSLKGVTFRFIEQSFREWLDIQGFAETTVYNLPTHIRELLHHLESITTLPRGTLKANAMAKLYIYKHIM